MHMILVVKKTLNNYCVQGQTHIYLREVQRLMQYDPVAMEKDIQRFWHEKNTYAVAKAKAEARGKKPFYFLDGPPYTSGRVHVGTAWNKALKDTILRYKRMAGFKVWDRAGYDMHGLPTENATMQKLGLSSNEDIIQLGIDKFIEECRTLSTDNLAAMNKDFARMGVWMDFDNAYQSITREFMSGEWWLVKRAHEQGRLYEGLRTMTWSAEAETALAKHELIYKTVTDTSIFLKFPLTDKKNEYLVIWTTTPWTIPFNLAVMVGPDIEYVRVKVGKEHWYVAKALVGSFLGSVVDTKYEVVEELAGEAMDGWKYTHPFHTELSEHYDRIKAESPKAFTVLLSKEYVDTNAGSGLVHCAPGCGPEDYEVGHVNGIRPFNTLSRSGVFPKSMNQFAGLRAKTDDAAFIKAFKDQGCLIATTDVEHEYPHDERYEKPVIFRTTKQWFFKVEDLKGELVAQNDAIDWVPQAAYHAFDSWLRNLRDNSISKQRFWGCPLPIWRNVENPDDYLVIGSADELETLSGQKIDDLHISTVDNIEIQQDGNTYRRVKDVLDVWVDAGTTSWNCLYNNEKLLKEFFPADFILEGKDQIRGWFNLLHIASMLGFGVPSFKACYMHGFVNDAQGRKMSKSKGNYILPEEVIDKYGADTMRYYLIGGANPGLDLNYNFDDVEVKHRNLHVFWNVHNYLLDLQRTSDLSLREPKSSSFGLEERYILSLFNATLRDTTKALEEYRLNEVPLIIEQCLLSLSRTYIQLVREKASMGSQEEKETVLWTAWTVFKGCMTLFAVVAPFMTERMYQDFLSVDAFGLSQESIHHEEWPEADIAWVDEKLVRDMNIAQNIISAVLAAREKANLGVRWPLAKVRVETQKKEVEDAVKSYADVIKQQTNAKEILLEKAPVEVVVKPNYRSLGKAFGQETGKVAEAILRDAQAIGVALGAGNDVFSVEGFSVKREMLDVTYVAAENAEVTEFNHGLVAISTKLTPELEAEGFSRELIRRVQQMRKEAGLEKRDRIIASISGNKELLERISNHAAQIQEKVSANTLKFSENVPGNAVDVTIRGKKFTIGIQHER